jgi:hypothetical protein
MIPRAEAHRRAKFMKQSFKEFTPIKKNIYIDRKKYTYSDDDAYQCTCEQGGVDKNSVESLMNQVLDQKKEDEFFGCGTNCLNKLVSAECVENLCHSGISCRNRRFQQQLYSEVFPLLTENRGWGLCAGEFLPKGTFVMQYIGEIYSIDSNYGLSKLKEYKNKTCTYLMEISKKEVIDPTSKGNLARFINHSCEPNCETQKWHVLGEICVGIFTLRDIQEGEELTFNYGFNILKTTFQKCLCGTNTCKGYLGIVSHNELPSGLDHIISCNICKNSCRNSEKIVVCENCKKVFHKTCVKNIRDDPGGRSESKVNNCIYICHHCAKKKKDNTLSSINSNMNTCFSHSFSKINLSDESQKNKEKKSSQQLLKEYRSRKKTTFNESPTLNNSNNSSHNDECLLIQNAQEENIISKNQEDFLNSVNENTITNNFSVGQSTPGHSEYQANSKKEEEYEIVTETVEVEESVLKRIKRDLKSLCNIGARLFWDYRQQAAYNQFIQIIITGTSSQIFKVKNQIYKLKSEKDISSDDFSIIMSVPQMFVRKIIGHQNRNLISYQMKYKVDIEYSLNFMSDEIFPICEYCYITLKGRENHVKTVEYEIKRTIENLKIITIYLMPNDYISVKSNICFLKTMIDPADMRLRKREYKNDREIKNAFYYVPCTNKDLVIIGFENEIKKAQKVINEFLLRQNTMEPSYSLCFLCPVFFLNQINTFQDENQKLFEKKNVILKIYDPSHSRKHLNVYLEGKWKDIISVKTELMKFLTENDKNSKKKNGLVDFVQYAYNQEHKLTSKNLKKLFLKENQTINNWDIMSNEILQVWEGASDGKENNVSNFLSSLRYDEDKNFSKDNKNFDAIYTSQRNSSQIDNQVSPTLNLNTNNLVKNFLDTKYDDSTLNYLLYLPPGAYSTVFNLTKLDLAKDLTYYVEEALNSYKKRRTKDGSVEVNSEVSEIPNNFSENNYNFNGHMDNSNTNINCHSNPSYHHLLNQISKEELNDKNLDFFYFSTKKAEKDDSNTSIIENLTDNDEENGNPDLRDTSQIIKNLEPQEKNKYHIEAGIQHLNNLNSSKFKENNLPNNFTNNFTSNLYSCALNQINDVKNDGKQPSLSVAAFPGSNYNAYSNIQNLPQSSRTSGHMINSPTVFPDIFNLQNFSNSIIQSHLNVMQQNSNNNLHQNLKYPKENEISSSSDKSSKSSDKNSKQKSKNLINFPGEVSSKHNYEILVSPEDLEKLLSNHASSQQPNMNSESMNISYTFSNINQMNININISSFHKDREQGEKKERFLQRKVKSDRSISPSLFRKDSNFKKIYERRDREKKFKDDIGEDYTNNYLINKLKETNNFNYNNNEKNKYFSNNSYYYDNRGNSDRRIRRRSRSANSNYKKDSGKEKKISSDTENNDTIRKSKIKNHKDEKDYHNSKNFYDNFSNNNKIPSNFDDCEAQYNNLKKNKSEEGSVSSSLNSSSNHDGDSDENFNRNREYYSKSNNFNSFSYKKNFTSSNNNSTYAYNNFNNYSQNNYPSRNYQTKSRNNVCNNNFRKYDRYYKRSYYDARKSQFSSDGDTRTFIQSCTENYIKEFIQLKKLENNEEGPRENKNDISSYDIIVLNSSIKKPTQ